MLIDDGESCFVKGLRICEEYEGRKLMPIFLAVGIEWAKTNGAKQLVSTSTDVIRPSCEPTVKMVKFII